ncbi:MAG: hypothetical protein H5U29_03320 [Pusillimonas sp.]|nr:hypothetical protein [Pusillimonas sp.]
MNPTLHAQILTLKKYQAWRTGQDERTMDEAGIKPAAITSALNDVIAIAENHLRDGMKKAEPVKVPSEEEIIDLWFEVSNQEPRTGVGHQIAFARALLQKYGTKVEGK